MNKTISVDRTWQIVQFEPFHVSDTITEIPDAVASNPDAIRLLRYLQLVDIEWSYIKYLELKLSEPKLNSAEAVKAAKDFLEEERSKTFTELLESISPKKVGEEETKLEE